MENNSYFIFYEKWNYLYSSITRIYKAYYNITTQMIKNLETYMKNVEYYNAINKLIEDIDYYYFQNLYPDMN